MPRLRACVLLRNSSGAKCNDRPWLCEKSGTRFCNSEEFGANPRSVSLQGPSAAGREAGGGEQLPAGSGAGKQTMPRLTPGFRVSHPGSAVAFRRRRVRSGSPAAVAVPEPRGVGPCCCLWCRRDAPGRLQSRQPAPCSSCALVLSNSQVEEQPQDTEDARQQL